MNVELPALTAGSRMFTRVAWRGRAGTLAVMDAQAIAVGVEAIEAGAALSALSLAAPRAEDEGGHAAVPAALLATRPLGSVLSHTRLQQRRAADVPATRRTVTQRSRHRRGITWSGMQREASSTTIRRSPPPKWATSRRE